MDDDEGDIEYPSDDVSEAAEPHDDDVEDENHIHF
jgi:hypothetical protein